MTYSEKSESSQSLLTKSETEYPLQVLSKVFMKYSLESILQSIKGVFTASFNVDLQRIIEAGHILASSSEEPRTDKEWTNCICAKLLLVLIDMIDAQLGLAEVAMNRLMEEHEFHLFATRPEVACHISTFRLIMARSRHLLRDINHKVKFSGGDFTLNPNISKFNLAIFVDEVTAPFKLYEDVTGRVIEIRNTVESSQNLLTDKVMLDIIISSLIHVAYAHSRKSTKVFILVEAANERLSFSVKSEGKQMSNAEVDNLFKPLNGSVTLANNWGANLYMAKKCIDILGGVIRVLSEKYETVIQASLPCLLR
ncbi:sensor histidine kinase [Chitinophaga sp. B61]|uniref:Sensor histidine kinase n=2 Tax=Chitinophaga rhizophila TaxID=2866212 RepID=A0ABS7GAJ1_9BACT|nr:sensor histidine kinase [Chitinophaga rhizophila]